MTREEAYEFACRVFGPHAAAWVLPGAPLTCVIRVWVAHGSIGDLQAKRAGRKSMLATATKRLVVMGIADTWEGAVEDAGIWALTDRPEKTLGP